MTKLQTINMLEELFDRVRARMRRELVDFFPVLEEELAKLRRDAELDEALVDSTRGSEE